MVDDPWSCPFTQILSLYPIDLQIPCTIMESAMRIGPIQALYSEG